MRQTRIGFWALMFLAPALVMAQDKEAPAELKLTSEKESVLVVKKSDAAFGRNELERQEKRYSLTGEIGFAVAALPEAGATFGFFLDPNSLIQIDYTYGSVKWWDYATKAKTTGIHYKHFVGDNFYYRAGATHRRVEMDYTGSYLFPADKTGVGVSEYVVADLAIGNQWQWSNFTLGCDWFGVMLPVIRIKDEFSTEGLSDYEKRDANENWDRVGAGITYQLVRFYLGATF